MAACILIRIVENSNMDALTIIRKLAVRTALLLGILVVVTLVINLSWFDEELHPDLQRLVPPRNVSMDGNAYPWIYGFPSADDRDFRQSGLDIVAALRQRFAAGEQVTLTAEETDRILGSGNDSETLGRQFPALACNARFELDCADRLLADIAESARFDSRLLLLLSRYETILGASRFEENQEFDAYTPLPDYRLLMEISRIRLAASLGGEPVPFIADVQRDIAFWKLMLRDGQSLVAKMVALAGIRNDLTFLSALMRRQPLDDSVLEAIGAAVAPLDDAQRDIGETFLAEMRISLLSSKSLGVLLEGPSWIHVLAMQPQAMYLTHYSRVAEVERLGADLHRLIDTMVAVASAARGTGVPRHVEILAGLEQIVREEAARQEWALNEDDTLELLRMDLELNAQGLGVWLDSQRVAEAETA